MQKAAVVAALSYLLASVACAQYPARGNPDPSFNAGKMRVQPFTDPAAGADRLDYVVPMSSVRFAGLGVRPNDATDFVAIVDTTPERIVSFPLRFDASSSVESLWTIAAAGTVVVTGGMVGSGASPNALAALQVREVGLHATPTFTEAGTLVSASPDPQLPDAVTTAVAAEIAGGTTRVWQARTRFNTAFNCGHTFLHRLDHAGTSLTERGSVDLASLLSRACLEAYYIVAHDRMASDPPAARALVVGALCRDISGGVAYFCATRVLDVGGSLSIDPAFGPGGLAVYGAGGAFNFIVYDVRIDAASGIVVGLDKVTSTADRSQVTGLLLRLDASGRLDTNFGSAGTIDIPSGGVNRIRGVSIAASGTLQAVGGTIVNGVERPYVFYYDPATRKQQLAQLDLVPADPTYATLRFNSVVSLAAGGAFAVGEADKAANQHSLLARLAGDRQTIDLIEYFHAAFGHYFLASVLAEMGKLDDGTFVGWERTGESFAAYPTAAAGAADVCRFFSATFTPRSSHFYTPIASECEGLKTGDVWGYEGLVFALQPASGAGICPAGSRNLYRLYNQGQGGAPNHRYTISDAIRTGQVGSGWVEEGNGTPPVFACVPT